MQTIAPGASWNGTAGSGFTSPPASVTRVTAKPALRLLVPPNQYYHEKLLVGVAAAANDNGSLLNALGLDKLVVYYEGNTIEIAQPKYHTFPDANGTMVTYYGWWFELTRASAVNGNANLYIEGYPRNGTFQKRLEGPHQFSPYTFAATGDQHDFKVTVAPSQATIAGTRYQTVGAANTYLVGQSAQNPLITITEGGTYEVAAVASTYQPNGRFKIIASTPVTFAKLAFTTDTASLFRTRINGAHFCGSNITFDMKNIGSIFRETGGVRQHWFDGVRFTDSALRGRLWRGGSRTQASGWLVGGNAYFTECNIDNLPNPGVNATLIRGGHFRQGFSDVVSDAMCVVGLKVSDWSNKDYAIDLDAFTVRYTGTEATATLHCDADGVGNFPAGEGANAAIRRFTLKWGANSATFEIRRAEGSANYWPSHVVNWINGLAIPGMTATLLNDSRQASLCSLRGLKGVAFNDTDIKSATLTVVTMVDLHNDFWQTVSLAENAILYDIEIRDFVGAVLFPTASTGLKDAIMFNWAAYNSPTSSPYDINANTYSQFGRVNSHVVAAHITLASQGVFLTNSYTADEHCLFAANSVRSMTWIAAVDNDLVIKDTHLHTGASNPTNGLRTTIGGDHVSLYVDAAGGNWTPSGAMLTNLKPSVVAFDAKGKKRATNDAAGALAA